MPIYDAAMRYQKRGVPLVVFAGKEYGTGSSRDWAAKGTNLLGVRAVIAQSFERIHRSNLVGMGVLPLVFEEGTSWQSLGLKGDETVTIKRPPAAEAAPELTAEITYADGREDACRWSAASIRSTRSSISATAASSTTCCAASRPDGTPRRQSQGAMASSFAVTFLHHGRVKTAVGRAGGRFFVQLSTGRELW